MKRVSAPLKNQSGISLIEIVIVSFIVLLLTSLITSLPSSVSLVQKSQHQSLAKNIASKELDHLKSLGYASLANTTTTFSDVDLPKLPYSTASYTVEDCDETICANEEQVKKLTVEVSWLESGKNNQVVLTTLISEGGLGQ